MGLDAGYGIGSVKPGVCTSTTRPGSPYTGQIIYETDTTLAKVWTGSAWVDTPPGKANIESPTFTGTVAGITKSMVGLGSVDNTADTAKPVSTAQQTALNLKADAASPAFTGNVQQNFVHGNFFRLDLAAGNNGAGTGNAQFNMWISEPAATWTGAGIARNKLNTSGSFPRINTGLAAQLIRFTETGSTDFTCTNSSGGENSFVFDPNGNAYKSGGGSWTALSDIRLKDNVRDYEKGTAELMQVRVREWEHNGKGGLQASSKGLGVVADEIELVLPDTVQFYEGKLNPEDEETTQIKSVNATEITWLLVKTVQEQQATIQSLTARIKTLEER